MQDAAINRWIIDSATDFAIVATDRDGRVSTWNEGARRILGWTESEMLGQPIDRIFTPGHRRRPAASRNAVRARTWRGQR